MSRRPRPAALCVRVALLGVLAVAGCGTAPGSGADSVARARAAGAPGALYPDFPMRLFEAHAEVCSRPGETVVRPSPTEIRCEALLPPEATGGLILEFDGTVEDLPRLVMAFVVEAQENGEFLVFADNYLRVPQRGGGVRQLRFPDAELDANLRELFRRSGGKPL